MNPLVLMLLFFLRKLFLWVGKKSLGAKIVLVQLLFANSFSLLTYAIAEGYELADWSGPPQLLKAFTIGVIPQLIWLAYDMGYYRASRKADLT